MSVIGGQNIPAINSLAYVIDFGNQRSYTSGSNTVSSIVYSSITGSFTGSIPNLVNGILQASGSTLRTGQTFPGFNFNSGNLTLMFSGEVKNSGPLFTQDGTLAVVATTSSIGYGNSSGSFGRNFPVSGFNHITLRFTSASMDCYVNGIPVSASGIFPTAPSSSTFTDFKIGGNYLPSAWTGSLSGSIGQLMVYNRQLTDDEIYSDYLIQARRYSLPERVKPYTIDSSAYVYTQAVGITDTTTINAINTFVGGLKSASLWDKMIAIYPFLGADTTKTRYNLKDVSLNTTQLDYSGSWTASTSGSKSNNTSSYGTLSNIKPTYNHPLISSQSIHLSYLSYDTPVSGGYLMGVEQLPGLPGDIATPAAAYSVRKVRTLYTGSAVRVRGEIQNQFRDIGFDSSGNLDTGSLLSFTATGSNVLAGSYPGLSVAYSLRRVTSSYSGFAIEVQSGSVSQSIGFDSIGNLDTGSLLTFAGSGDAFVKTWYDQSGNNNHATQSVTLEQPKIVNSGIIITDNSKPCLSFTSTGLDGGSRMIIQNQIISGNEFSFFSIANFESPNNYEYLFSQDSGGDTDGFRIRRNATANRLEALYLSSAIYSSDTIDNSQKLISFLKTPSLGNLYMNSRDQGSLNNSSNIIGTQPTIGARTLVPKLNLTGKIQEILIYSSSQTNNRNYIENNINTYYNIYTTSSVSTENAFVSTWYDQSGNNRHVTQTTSSRQPLMVSSGSIMTQNGKSTINHIGTQDLKLATVLDLGTTHTMLGAIKFDSYNKEFIGKGGSPNGWSYAMYNLGGQVDTEARQAVGRTTETFGLNFALFQYYRNGTTTVSMYKNNNLLGGNSFTLNANNNFDFKSLSGEEYDSYNFTGNMSEVIIYTSSQLNNRPLIEQNTNTYFNIFTPTGINQNTNSLSLYSNPTTVLGAANNLISASFTTGGPLGLITVSRTGSAGYTLWKNKVDNKVTLPASLPQTSSFFLSAANVNNAIFSGSQNNIAYASVGAGLTDSEVGTYYDLVDTLQTNLGRGVTNPGAFISTWDTRLTGSGTSNSSSVVLPLYGTQAITASWGDGTTSIISSSAQVDKTHSYAIPGIYTVTITGSGQGFFFASGGDRTKLLDIGQWGSISASVNQAFQGATNVLGTAGDYPPLQTTNLSSFFSGATKFNGNINNWRPVSCSDFRSMFYSATTFNQPLRDWIFATTGSVNIDMSNMFQAATSFNQDIGSWNTVRVTNMGGMFFDNGMKFNNGGSDSIKNWNTSNVTNMSYMFWRCTFNQPIGTWNVGNVTNFDRMFWQSAFNQNIGAWNVEKATSMDEMFGYLGFTNSGSTSINNWRPISCSTFTGMFRDSSFNQPIGNWPISASNINMTNMFGATPFNQNIGAWDVSKVTSMSSMFQSATAFNNSGSNTINNWRPISCSNFSSMFYNATAFNQPVANWPLSASSINMSNMFGGDSSGVSCKFNQPLNTWDTSRVTNMSGMFFRNTAFNQDLGAWNTSNVTNTSYMFYGCTAFNNSGSSTIGNWNTSNITSFNSTFEATPFNQNIGLWNVSKVTDFGSMFNGSAFNNGGNSSIGNWLINTSSAVSMTGMFRNNYGFNQNISTWNTSKVTNMSSMFDNTGPFNQNLGSWLIPSCSNMASMLNNCGMDKANYSATLTGWASQAPNIKSNVTLGATGRQYDTPGSASRAILTSAPYNWTITGDTYVP